MNNIKDMTKTMTDTETTIEMAACGNKFMRIMQDYQERQNDDPNFDPRTQIYDLYDDMVHLYESNLFKLFNLPSRYQ